MQLFAVKCHDSAMRQGCHLAKASDASQGCYQSNGKVDPMMSKIHMVDRRGRYASCDVFDILMVENVDRK